MASRMVSTSGSEEGFPWGILPLTEPEDAAQANFERYRRRLTRRGAAARCEWILRKTDGSREESLTQPMRISGLPPLARPWEASS